MAAILGCLPEGFQAWDASDLGVTAADIAAASGTLPGNFDRWDMRSPDGATVAHRAVRRAPLPASVTPGVWLLLDGMGNTVYHEAAEHRNLPAGFDMWELSRKDGLSVAHVAAMQGSLPPDVPDAVLRLTWRPSRGMAISVADVVLGELPIPLPTNCAETRRRARLAREGKR
jgi:hypothetical protein